LYTGALLFIHYYFQFIYNMKNVLLGIALFLITVVATPLTVLAATETVRIYGGIGDGQISTAPYPGSWEQHHSSSVGRVANHTSDFIHLKSGAFHTPTGYLTIERGFFVFDTSVLPDDANILNVRLHTFIKQKKDDFDDNFAYLNVVKGFQSDAAMLSNDDIDTCGDKITNPTKGADDVDITSLSAGAYTTFNLNNTGREWVSKISPTKLCIREGHDIENVETIKNINDGLWKWSGVDISSADAPGTEFDPYLEIEYSVPTVEEPTFPLYTQRISPYPSVAETTEWADDTFARSATENALSGCETIAKCGCTITSLTMLGRSYGITTGIDGSDVNPGNLNRWLIANKGYTSEGLLRFDQAIKYFGVERNGVAHSYFSWNPTFLSENAVKSRAANGTPTVASMVARNRDGSVIPTHFVVVTTLLADGSYGVRDPLWYNTEQLDDTITRASWVQDYNNNITNGRNLTYVSDPKPVTSTISLSMVGAVAATAARFINTTTLLSARANTSPVTAMAEMYVTTPTGAKIGMDPRTGETFTLQNGEYWKEAQLTDPLAENYITPTLYIKSVALSNLTRGTYTLTVVGIGTGSYTITGLTHDSTGREHPLTITAETTAGKIDVYTINSETGVVAKDTCKRKGGKDDDKDRDESKDKKKDVKKKDKENKECKDDRDKDKDDRKDKKDR
jgi:hypothetical protein